MKHIALTILLSGCATVSYWQHNPNNPIFEDADIHFVRMSQSEGFTDHCGNFATACAVRCVTLHPESAKMVCRPQFGFLPSSRWRCVIVSTYSREQLELMRDRNGMPLDQHEIRHCKGEDHGY